MLERPPDCQWLGLPVVSEHQRQFRAGQRGAGRHGRWQRSAVCREDGVGAATRAQRHCVATRPRDRDRACIHDPRLPLSSPTCGLPEHHRRRFGGLRDSDEGPGAGVAGAASGRAWSGAESHAAVKVSGVWSSRGTGRTLLLWLGAQRICKELKEIFQKYSQRPAITRRGPSHLQLPAVTLAPWPKYSPACVTHCDLSHSPGRGAARRHAQRPAWLTRPGPSH